MAWDACMRTLALALALLAGFALVPAPAAAHACGPWEPVCVVLCPLHLGHCSVEEWGLPGLAPCPEGEAGVVLVLGSTAIPACLEIGTFTFSPCPTRQHGVVVHLGGDPTPACVGLE